MSSSLTLNLPSDWTYIQVREFLDGRGFLLVGEGTLPPLVPGEPELANFTWREADAEVVYTHNPVSGLRELQVFGPHAEFAAARLREEREEPPAEDPPPAEEPLPDELQERAEAFLALVAEQLERRPDALVWASLDAPTRRQVLRWFLAEQTTGPRVAATLRQALSDEDWEVRLTAMLAVARLRHEDLGLAVRRCVAPGAGATREDREVFRAVQRATLQHLSGQPVRPGHAWTAVREAVAGTLKTGALADCLHALSTPLRMAEPEPIVRCGLPMALVPAIEHRVGVLDLRTDRGLTRHTPAPFLICTRPLTRGQVGLRSQPEAPWRGSRAEALQVLDELGPGLRLPTFLQWQCALRGPDGRQRPWGMGAGEGPSPWGCWSGDGPELVVEGRAHPGWRSGDDGLGLLRPVSRPISDQEPLD